MIISNLKNPYIQLSGTKFIVNSTRVNGSCSDTELIFILLALTLFFITQSKQSHHLESYLDSSSEYNALTTFKLPYGNTTSPLFEGLNLGMKY